MRRNKCEYDCSLFSNNLLLERLGIRVMKRKVGSDIIWRFEERCQLIYYQEPFWILFICSVCIPVVLIQSNFDTPGDTSRSDTN